MSGGWVALICAAAYMHVGGFIPLAVFGYIMLGAMTDVVVTGPMIIILMIDALIVFLIRVAAHIAATNRQTKKHEEELERLHAEASMRAARAAREAIDEEERRRLAAEQERRREQAAAWRGVLGVSANATLDDAKSAFRRLAKQHHPDMPGGDKAKFLRVQAAWEQAERAYKK